MSEDDTAGRFTPPAVFVIDDIVVGIKQIHCNENNSNAWVDYEVADHPDYPLPDDWQTILDVAMPKFINKLLKEATEKDKL